MTQTLTDELAEALRKLVNHHGADCKCALIRESKAALARYDAERAAAEGEREEDWLRDLTEYRMMNWYVGLRSIAATLARLEVENERLRKAIEEYADVSNWACSNHHEAHDHRHGICTSDWWQGTEQGYEIARAALTPGSQTEHEVAE